MHFSSHFHVTLPHLPFAYFLLIFLHFSHFFCVPRKICAVNTIKNCIICHNNSNKKMKTSFNLNMLPQDDANQLLEMLQVASVNFAKVLFLFLHTNATTHSHIPSDVCGYFKHMWRACSLLS